MPYDAASDGTTLTVDDSTFQVRACSRHVIINGPTMQRFMAVSPRC